MTDRVREPLRARGTGAELWALLGTPEIAEALVATEHVRGRMLPYQCAALYRLAAGYDGGHILEIGCYYGRSSLLMSMAAPAASIVTMSPDEAHVRETRTNRTGHKIAVIRAKSWDFLETDRRVWDMIYVDGDHKRVMQDVPWFNRLSVGGLLLFHDWTPGDALRLPHPIVCEAVEALGERLRRPPDVAIVDDHRVGMAGFYRHEGETW